MKTRLTVPFKHRGRVGNLQGKVFHWLTVIDRVMRPSDIQPVWLCQCKCGNFTHIQVGNLIKGGVKSCGCFSKDPANRIPDGESGFKRLLHTYRHNSKTRGSGWNLSDDQARKLFQSNCHYCGSPPDGTVTGRWRGRGRTMSPFTYNGVDRKDNEAGYTPENSVPCCKICNFAKRDLGYEEFLAWIRNLIKHQQHFAPAKK